MDSNRNQQIEWSEFKYAYLDCTLNQQKIMKVFQFIDEHNQTEIGYEVRFVTIIIAYIQEFKKIFIRRGLAFNDEDYIDKILKEVGMLNMPSSPYKENKNDLTQESDNNSSQSNEGEGPSQ